MENRRKNGQFTNDDICSSFDEMVLFLWMKERSPKPNLDDLEEVKGISVENAFVAEKVC